MAQLVKPSTPVVILFNGGKKLTLHAEVIVRLFPKFSESVRALPITTDKKDGESRAILDLTGNAKTDAPTKEKLPTLTLEEAAKLASYTCGGAYDPSAYSLFKRFGIPIPDTINASNLLPNVSLYVKGRNANAAIMVLSMRRPEDGDLAMQCKGIKILNGAFPDIPDSLYSVATRTLEMTSDNKVIIARSGDLAHTFVLKVELEGPTDLSTLFESVSLAIGGREFVDIDLSTNIALAKAYDLWPSKINDSPKQAGQKWVATIPIVFRETTAHTKVVQPMVALCWHDCVVELHRIANKDAKFALDVDYVYVERPARDWLANDGATRHISEDRKPVVEDSHKEDEGWSIKPKDDWAIPTPMVKEVHNKGRRLKAETEVDRKDPSPSETIKVTSIYQLPMERQLASELSEKKILKYPDGHKFFFTQYQTIREYLAPGLGNTRRIRLDMKHPISGFLITLSPEDVGVKQAGNNVAPIISAAIEFNSNRGMEFDFSDLTEWNWIKCGMKVPTDFCTLLMPASREMFLADKREDVIVCPSTIILSRMDSVVLVLTLNDEMFEMAGWTANITAISINISNCRSGMEGKCLL